MQKPDIAPGSEYAIRERRVVGGPFQRVKILEHIRHNKWKAKWLDPNPGLIDYVESAQVIVAWGEQRAYLKDEENAAALSERNRREGYEPRSPVTEAVEQVIDEMHDDIVCTHGDIRASREALTRILTRIHEPGRADPIGSYVDRKGKVHWPFKAGLELAQRFCAAEPSTVLVAIEATEREWATKASRPGDEYIIPLLNQYRANWAIIRQWTGHDPAVAEREAYIERLQRLVWDAIYALQKAGLDSEAARLRHILERR
jgi:hypothetical protein